MKKTTIEEFFKYILVGGTCTFIDVLILFFVTEYIGISYLLSSIFSFLVGVFINYFLCVFWIFKVKTAASRMHEFSYYLIITFGAMCINTFIIWILSEFFAVFYLIAKLIASLVTLIYNFALRKFFIHSDGDFSHSSRSSDEKHLESRG